MAFQHSLGRIKWGPSSLPHSHCSWAIPLEAVYQYLVHILH